MYTNSSRSEFMRNELGGEGVGLTVWAAELGDGINKPIVEIGCPAEPRLRISRKQDSSAVAAAVCCLERHAASTLHLLKHCSRRSNASSIGAPSAHLSLLELELVLYLTQNVCHSRYRRKLGDEATNKFV